MSDLISKFEVTKLLSTKRPISMSIDDSIVTKIYKDLSFTKDEQDLIIANFEKVELKKGDILLKENDIVNYQYYVSSGCLRTFYTDNSTKEHTLQFAINDWWISDFTAFFTTSKAAMTIECLQDAVVYKISRMNSELLLKEIPILEPFFRKKVEKGFAALQKRILSNLSQSAKERYLSFITAHPNIEQNIKNYHIASYLGITTESLSRIRKEISKK